MQWSLEQVLQATGGERLSGRAGQGFAAVSIDSRTLSTAALFVALRGERYDGHAFVAAAIAKGARGVLIDKADAGKIDCGRLDQEGVACVAVADTLRALGALAAFHRSRFNIPLAAVTGSTGKTSTRQMTELVLARSFATLATPGNLNNEIGVPLTLFQLNAGHTAAVVELGMNHAGEIDRLGAICRPTIGLITNVGPVHLEFFASLEAIARAKGELMAHVLPGGAVVLNADDPQSATLAACSPQRVLLFGTGAAADVRAEQIHATAQGVVFELVLPNGRSLVQLQTPGRCMVGNALAAAAVGYLSGLTAEQIQEGLEAFRPLQGRLTILQTARGVSIIDDTYNANPVSMAAALDTLTALKGGARAFIVLGDMLELGGQADELHQILGRQAAGCGAAHLYAHGRYAAAVLAGARAAGMAPADTTQGEKDTIAADLTTRLQAGDWLLVKGSRGVAMETVVTLVQRWAAQTDVPRGERA